MSAGINLFSDLFMTKSYQHEDACFMDKSKFNVEHIEKFLIDHYLLTAFASSDSDVARMNIEKAQVLNGPFTLYKIANHYREARKFEAAIDLYFKAYEQGLCDS